MKTLIVLFSVFTVSSLMSQNFWQKTSFPSGSQVNSVYSLLSLSDNSILAGTFADGIFKSTDNGLSWLPSGLSSQWIIKLRKDSLNNLYALSVGSAFGSGLFKSTDNGTNWSRVWEYQGGLNCLYVEQNNNIYIGLQYSGGQGGVFKSSNGGVSWSNIFSNAANVYSIIKALNGTLLIAVYESGFAKIYRSSNEGVNWDSYSFGINFSPTDFAISTNGNIFLSTAGYGIYKSIDNGVSWNISAPVGWDYSSLYLSGNNIYAGTRGNWVYRSTDLGITWNLINSGMGQDNYILSLEGNSSGFLFAGMDYFGIYRSVNQVLSIIEDEISVKDFILYQNYPNPFNPSTTIRFSIGHRSQVTLNIFDMLGREFATLVNEELNPGEHSIVFDPIGITSGVYFYQLKAGTFIQTKRMLILK